MARRKTSRRTARRSNRTRNRSHQSHSFAGRSLYHRRLRLEPLEDRRLLAVVTVTTLSDTVDFTDGLTSLREAIFAANIVPGADTIDFAPSLTAGGPAKILLTQGELAITDPLAIDGPGADALTIDAQQQSRIFDIVPYHSYAAAPPRIGDCTITGLTLTGGGTFDEEVPLWAAKAGGAIRSASGSLLTIGQCVISGNEVLGTVVSGSAIYAKGDLKVSDTTISGNVSPFGMGSSIFAVGDVAIDHSIVRDNAGGGIATTGRATIVESEVSGNTGGFDPYLHSWRVYAFGAGIYAGNGLALIGSTVRGNSGAERGGGIFSGADASIAYSTVSGNSATYGGGVLADGDLTIVQSTLSGNQAANGGGVLAYGNLTVAQSTITGNRASKMGGGIFANGNLTVAQSTIAGNQARYGGGIDAAGNLTVTQCTIASNQARYLGGGILASSYYSRQITIAGTVLAGNTTSVPYRVIDSKSNVIFSTDSDLFYTAYSSILLSDSIVGVNYRTNLVEAPIGLPDANGNLIGGPVHGAIDPLLGPLADNGGFTLPDGSHILTMALLPGSPAINAGDLNAVAGQNGVPQFDERGTPFGRVVGGRIDIGAFEYQSPSDLNLFVDTLVDESDGNYSRGDLSLREAIELANHYSGADTIHFDPALTASGPATILLTHGELKITDSASAIGPGANLLTIDASGNDPTPDVNDRKGSRVFDIDDSHNNILKMVTLSGMTLTGGDVYGNGGAVFSRENLTIASSIISGNSVWGDMRGLGGGVYCGPYSSATLAHLKIQDSTISGNLTNQRGGGIATNRADLTVTGSTIIDNLAGSGGGIWSRGGDLAISSSGLYFNSVAGSGGGIYRYGGMTTISSSQIYGNSAGSGGGIDSSGSALTITDSSFGGNIAQTGDGGAIRNLGSSMNVSKSVIQNNWARDGGGIYGESTITGSIISSNHGRDGGGIWGRSINVVGSTIDNNVSYRGGGIYCYGNLTVADSTLTDNKSYQNGGAVFNRGEVTITSSTISGNSAYGSGGGLYSLSVEAGSATIEHSTIASNEANVFGGGVAFIGGKLELDHSIVATNFAFLGPDLTGLLETIVESTFSLIGDKQNSGMAEAPVGLPDANGNLIGGPVHGAIDPRLGPLADNGGFALPDGSHSFTRALLPGSPAINAGDPTAVAGANGVPANDQRGAPFTRVYGGRIDIGAVESQPNPLPGDYNFNGIVDTADYTRWRDSLSSHVAAGSGADGNGDAVVNQFDYDVWKANFGATMAVGGRGASGEERGASVGTGGKAEIAVSSQLSAVSQTDRRNMNSASARISEDQTTALRSVVAGDRARLLPPADPLLRVTAAAAGLLTMHAPFETTARQDLLFDAWLAAPDRAPQRHEEIVTRRYGDDAISHDPATDDTSADTAAAFDCAFALLGQDGM